MTEYLFIGVLVSLIFSELTGLSPGGIIVPAYFAIFLTEPQRMLSTALLALVCVAAVRFLSRYMILYGRRRFAMFLLTGMALKSLLELGYHQSGLVPGVLTLTIGWLIPGLLAKDIEKQGAVSTVLSLGICAVLTRMVCMLVMP